MVRDPRLTVGEKALWLLYRSYDLGKGAWPSDQRVAEHLGVSERSVQDYRAGLKRLGFLVQRLRGPHTATYWPVVPAADPTEPPRQAPPNLNGDGHAALTADCVALIQAGWPEIARPAARADVFAYLAEEEPTRWKRAGLAFERLDLSAVIRGNKVRVGEIDAQLSAIAMENGD